MSVRVRVRSVPLQGPDITFFGCHLGLTGTDFLAIHFNPTGPTRSGIAGIINLDTCSLCDDTDFLIRNALNLFPIDRHRTGHRSRS
mmetsp:Transcript_31461/g.31929  ORF Transcript_31461/g.31929 Transcript_31461/m.31929 type:complete len:86 (+) Transcript_31461:74-331(+)